MQCEGDEDGEEVGSKLLEDVCATFIDGGNHHAEDSERGTDHDPLGDPDHDVIEGLEEVPHGFHLIWGELSHGYSEHETENE